jgi:hypothetical protein
MSVDNVFTISSDLLEAYHDNRITIDPQVQMFFDSTIDRLLTELHRMDIASFSLQNFHTLLFLCWIASVCRLRLAASGALACAGHWLSASLVAMPHSMVSALWKLGSFSTNLLT